MTNSMTRHLLLLGLFVGAAANPVSGALVPPDSSTFEYQWEMDVLPSSQDLDNNGSSDYFPNVAGGLIEPQVSGGIAISDTTASPGEALFRTDFGGSITRNVLAPNTPYWLEVSIKLDDTTTEPDDVGVAGIALQLPGDGTGLRMNIGASNVSFNFDGIDSIPTPDNTDGFHRFQFFRNAPNSYFIYRDDVLLNPGGAPIFGTNFFNGNGAWFIGNFSSSLGGEFEVDYIRMTPVPEPGSVFLCLGTLAALAVGRRR